MEDIQEEARCCGTMYRRLYFIFCKLFDKYNSLVSDKNCWINPYFTAEYKGIFVFFSLEFSLRNLFVSVFDYDLIGLILQLANKFTAQQLNCPEVNFIIGNVSAESELMVIKNAFSVELNNCRDYMMWPALSISARALSFKQPATNSSSFSSPSPLISNILNVSVALSRAVS